MTNAKALRRRACPVCGLVPRYWGRRELVRFLRLANTRLRTLECFPREGAQPPSECSPRDAAQLAELAELMLTVLTETDGQCGACMAGKRA